MVVRRGLTRLELAYLGGIVDGEGTIGIGRRAVRGYSDQYIVYFVVPNTNVILTQIMKRAFGGNVMTYKVTGNRKPLYRWELTTDAALVAIKVVAPYLKLKREQARLVLEFAANRTRRIGHPISDEEQRLRHSYWERVAVLNHRGTSKVTNRPVRTISREVR